MIVNYKKHEIQIKIVYFGCAMSGKTTSLRNLFRKFNKSYELKSIETSTGRTLFFDFGTLKMKGGDWTIKLLLYTATGQDFYASTRPSTLAGTDGVIFIVDSQKEFFQDNLQSWNELKFYFGDDLSNIPIIMCLNKMDLPEIISEEDLVPALHLNTLSKLKLTKTIASQGVGIEESFKHMLNFIFPTIAIRN